MRKVLVVIDMQNDFIDGALGTKEAQAMLPRLEAKLAREDALLVFTQDTHGADYLETQEEEPACASLHQAGEGLGDCAFAEVFCGEGVGCGGEADVWLAGAAEGHRGAGAGCD